MQCPACGAEVRTVELPDGGTVRIDIRSEVGKGPNRYMVDGEDADKASPVAANWEGEAHNDHRFSCPSRELAQQPR